jgi:hypothetical protein
VQESLDQKAARSVPTDGGVPENVVIPSGKYGGKTVGELVDTDFNYLKWLSGAEAKTPEWRRAKGAAITVVGAKAA